MRAGPEGKPFVPPTCPTDKTDHIPDLSVVPFELVFDAGPERDTEIWASFVVRDEEGEVVSAVHANIIDLPPDAPQVRRLKEELGSRASLAWANWLTNAESPLVEALRARFCDRVSNCHGVVDGECWALGERAMRQMIDETLEEHGK